MTPEPCSVELSSINFVIAPYLRDKPQLLDLKRYWDRKRGARRMPTRVDIDPLELPQHLGWLYLIDVSPGLSDFRYRLLGSRITEAYGRDSTGRTVREVHEAENPDYCSAILALYRTIARDAIVAHEQGSLSVAAEQYRQYDVLYLPLDRGDGSVGMILAEMLLC
ncbi:MAG TPA: PAS domain-containing protein [Stellaceae bacterium]|nr:PAS domain-containing protein [Stellaceae bacterium]